MSVTDLDGAQRPEIIVVKRSHGDHDEGSHGGVWKIAFADFMTALMCLFLVMWLVSATDQQTKAAVASYFNPMAIMETQDAGPGVDDPGDSPPAPDAPAEAPADENDARAPERPQGRSYGMSAPGDHATSDQRAESEETSDRHLFADPYAVLAEIAADAAQLQNMSDMGDGGVQTSGPATGADGGRSYRDPFAPDFWSREIADVELDVFRRPEPDAPQEAAPEDEGEAQEVAEALPPVPDEPAQAQAPDPAVELAETLRAELAGAFGEGHALNRTIAVVPRSEGVLISVTDDLNFGMFQVGSAVPQGELVLAMEKIAASLAAQEGRVRINGHTDGRPFRSQDYDNWRLSTARAHSAYYMLVRGGLDEQRVREVAGFADRDLKFPEDPYADGNRRIEIFLETGG